MCDSARSGTAPVTCHPQLSTTSRNFRKGPHFPPLHGQTVVSNRFAAFGYKPAGWWRQRFVHDFADILSAALSFFREQTGAIKIKTDGCKAIDLSIRQNFEIRLQDSTSFFRNKFSKLDSKIQAYGLLLKGTATLMTLVDIAQVAASLPPGLQSKVIMKERQNKMKQKAVQQEEGGERHALMKAGAVQRVRNELRKRRRG